MAEVKDTDEFMSGALVTWLKSCLPNPNRITDYSSLFDSDVLYSVLLQINAESQVETIDIKHLKGDSLCNARTRNFESIIQNVKLIFEKDMGKKMLVRPDSFALGYYPISANGLEEMKLLLKLLIGAAVQCSKKDIFLERIKKLDAKTQNEIDEFIKEVTDYFVLTENSVHLMAPATLYKHLRRASKERENMYVKWTEAVYSSSEELDHMKLELQSTSAQLKAAETSAENLRKENGNLLGIIATLQKKLNCLPAELSFSSPDNRLKQSLTSTPNRHQQHVETKTKTQLSSDLIGTQCNFIVPSVPGRRSCASDSSRQSWNILQTGSNTSNTSLGYNSRDSFSIPETQQFPGRTSLSKSCDETIADSDVGTNDMLNSRNESAEDDSECCIPETQEVFVLPSSQMRKNKFTARAKNDGNLPTSIIAEEGEDATNPIADSQIRICTQDFNDVDLFDDDSNSNDFMAGVPDSIVIPRIKHDTVLLDEAGKVMENGAKPGDDTDKEMSALQWSEPGSKCSTIHKESSQREDACTPDLFDLPELAQQNAKDINTCDVSINVESNRQSTGANIDDNTAVFAFEAPSPRFNMPAPPSRPKIIVPPPFEDDDDLLPTQVFTTKPQVDKNDDADKCSPVFLTLSDKENVQPAAAAMFEDVMQPTQVFDSSDSLAANPSVRSCKDDEQLTSHIADAAIDAVESANSSNITLAPVIKVTENQEEDEDDLLPTQVFSRPIPNSKTNNSEKPCTSKFLSSTLQTKTEAGVKNALNFFAKQQEHTPQKKSSDGFLKPFGALSKKSSTLSNASMSESPDIDMLLCTPQIIAENFEQPDEATKKNLLAKQKTLFGDDSDDESDVLKLISVPRVSHAFDKLLPHLTKHQLSPKREDVAAKMHQYNRSFGQSDECKTEKAKEVPKRTARSRDERHTARDNNREKITETVPKPDKKESVTRKTRKTNKLVEAKTTSTALPEKAPQTKKRQNVEPSASKTTAKKSKEEKPTKEKKQEEQPAEKRASKKSTKVNSSDNQAVTAAKRITRSGSQSSNIEIPIELPPRRKTRLQSRVEEVVNKQKSIHIELEHKSEEGSCSRIRSCSTTSLDGSNTSKGSMSTTASTTTANSSRKTKMLKVSMTMVNTDVFQNLAKNSAGIWSVANDPSESDVLIMDKGNRTFKFLIAMARGIPIVRSSWLDIINKNRGIVSFSEHCYVDKDFEKRHKFSLLKSIELARKQKVFADFHFLMTPDIRPQPNELEEIIKFAGGTVHTDVPAWKDNQKLYLISSKADQKLWHKYRRLNNNIRIISSEGVMAAVMRQNVKPLDTNLLS